jgi:Nucleotidyl transferase AbiEii toxin, Type IV TA system
MTIAERLQIFQDRGFNRETSAVLVLIEEALHSIFVTFPDAFVLFGGATLVLFYGSQRHSGDIDLLPNSDETPKPEEIINAIRPDLTGEICTRWNERESTWRKKRSWQSRGISQSKS